ncbi:YbgA family protein [Echinimonas agarilytica]|uniref:DUF523 and DUF1722 domain-containing protein n=1 Tax=Echinimonas agarilytica TaxID=1215918 RepID=A0AA41W6R1_9GAMM|nr:DUF523 and DUF1722 domain-containing protein [Echinimonas agarilytica]MCM2679992.1 DUF523 and DUF1722 domain-containing protein [Echinimonas agarilytica]
MKFIASEFDSNSIKVGVSACVVGQPVRFDGGHKQSTFAQSDLSPFVEYVPVCPEVAIGMGVPRPTIRLVDHDGDIRVQGSTKKEIDVTEDLRAFSHEQVTHLNGLSGYIVCAKSPTCGFQRIKIYHPEGHLLTNDSAGVYTQALMKAHPLLPIEDNGRLCDPVLKENFVTRVFAYHDWQTMVASGITPQKMVEFHSRYKFLVMANHVPSYRMLGELLGDLKRAPLEDIADEYIAGLMFALTQRPGRKGNTNALMHLQGYFKRFIGSDERQALADVIDKYRVGELPLMAPITLLRHLLVKFPNQYLSQQVYLKPYPDKLALRNLL